MAKSKKVINNQPTETKNQTKTRRKAPAKTPAKTPAKAQTNKKSSKRPVAKKTTRTSKTKTLETETNTPGICRALCFSNFHNEIQDLILYILEIKSQTYIKNIDYIINIKVNSKQQENSYKNILNQYANGSNIKIVFSHDEYTDNNDLKFLQHMRSQKYNTFIYCDSEFRYYSNHIHNTIDLYNDKHCDVLQIACSHKIDNDIKTQKCVEKKYNFVFNNKALDIILDAETQNYESWISSWSHHKVKLRQMGNISTLYLIDKPKDVSIADDQQEDSYYKVLENEHFTLCIFEHNYWSSYVYLNKRNNRMYNVMNDDHGAFDLIDDHKIKITWDTWGDEIFYKKYNGDQYHYSINE